MKYLKLLMVTAIAIAFAQVASAQTLQVDNRTNASYNDIIVVYVDFSTEQFSVAGQGVFNFPLSGVVDRVNTSGVSLIPGSSAVGTIATTGDQVDCSMSIAPGGDKVIVLEDVLL